MVNNHRQDGYSPQTVEGRPALQTIISSSLSQLTLMFFELPPDPGQRGNCANKPLIRTIRCTANDATRECVPTAQSSEVFKTAWAAPPRRINATHKIDMDEDPTMLIGPAVTVHR